MSNEILKVVFELLVKHARAPQSYYTMTKLVRPGVQAGIQAAAAILYKRSNSLENRS